jgi:hypothetical protein
MTTAQTESIDIQAAKQAFSLFTKDGQVIELRALDATLYSDRLPYDKPRVIAGWFDNVDALIAALPQIASAAGIYITINPCQPALLARANNRLKDKKVTATTDDQIVTRQYLLLDADPEREGHVTGVPSNDAEHQIALDFVRDVCDELRSEGWPEPFRFDSGNGGYALYAVDLPANDNGLIERALKGLAQRFDTEQVHIDQTTFNQSRIMRLPGTLNCKGDGTPDRPHRPAKLLSIPEDIQIVPSEQLEAIAVPVEQKQPKQEQKSTDKGTSRKKRDKNTLSAKDFIEKHELATIREAPYKGGTKYLLTECPFCHETDHSACIYDTPMTEPYIGFSCSHNRCTDLTGGDLWRLFESDDTSLKKPSATILLTEIADEANLICTPSGALFARVPVNGHHEIVSINEKGSGFKRWMIFKFKREYGHVPNSDAVSQVMAGVQSEAEFAGERVEVFTRIAEKDGCIYLDLADNKWQCVEISNDGWRVITCPPVYFRRPSGMLPLPMPITGGSLDELKELINAKEDRDYKLITAWLVGTLHPKGPYPALNLNGERGSTKSKGTSILRNIVDPNIAPTRTVPKDDREAAILAQNSMVIALDNLSSVPLWLSDLLCRIATGSGFSSRELYTDDGERVFNNRRPIIMNGIEDGIITQGDLLNRTIMVTLTPPDEYRSEEAIDELFKQKHPSILGALLTAASVSLRDRRHVELDSPPRMADFAMWVAAAEPALGWKAGTFMDAYIENQESATSIVVESSPVAKAIIQFMASHKRLTDEDEWKGFVSGLHDELMHYNVYKDAKTAPKGANKLTGHLKRIISSMRVQGINIHLLRRNATGSPVVISVIAPVDTDPEAADNNVGSGPDNVGSGPDNVGSGPDNVGSFSVPTQSTNPLEQPIDDENSRNNVGSVGSEHILSTLFTPLDFEKEEEKERNNGRVESKGKVPTLPTQPTQIPDGIEQSDVADLQSEYRVLYQQIGESHKKLAPLGNIQWYVPDAGYDTGQVTTTEYMQRLKELYISNNHHRIQAGLEEMRRKLRGMQ